MTKKFSSFSKTIGLSFFAVILFFAACGQPEIVNTMEENEELEEIEEQEDQEYVYQPPGGDNDMSALDEFIFKPDRFSKGVVPRKYESKAVAEFLIEKLNKNSQLNNFEQAEKAAEFYDTFEIADKFKSFLDKTESGDTGVLRSIIITRTIGRVGKPEDVSFARNYYQYLIPKLNTQKEFEEFIALHEVLGLGTTSKSLREKIKQKTAELESKKTSDYSAEVQFLNFQGAVEQKMSRAEKVEDEKNSILAITERKRRITEEIKAYLGLEYGFTEYIEPWSAKRIRRETWGLQPGEQIVRDEKPALKKEIADVFRSFLSTSEIKALDPEERDSVKIKILRAIKFFDGKISGKEEEFLKTFAGEQADTLANEGFLLPKKPTQ